MKLEWKESKTYIYYDAPDLDFYLDGHLILWVRKEAGSYRLLTNTTLLMAKGIEGPETTFFQTQQEAKEHADLLIMKARLGGLI